MFDDAPRDPAEEPADFDDFEADFWTDAAADADPTGANIFTAEIENVNSSDWEMDPDVIWGDVVDPSPDVDGGALGPDDAI